MSRDYKQGFEDGQILQSLNNDLRICSNQMYLAHDHGNEAEEWMHKTKVEKIKEEIEMLRERINQRLEVVEEFVSGAGI